MPRVELSIDLAEVEQFPISEIQSRIAELSLKCYANLPEAQIREFTDVTIVPAYRIGGTALYVKVFYQSETKHRRVGLSTQELSLMIGERISKCLSEAGCPRKLVVRAFVPACSEDGEALGVILDEEGSRIGS